MESTQLLMVSGVLLLAISALLGFVQERYRDSPDKFAQWRVVHAGGAGGAVQLLALSAVWERLANGNLTTPVAWALIAASWAFFLGPLARAMDQPDSSRWINRFGAVAAVPAYLLLPVLLVR